MPPNGKISIWKIALMLIVLASLACNLPAAFLKFKDSGEEPEKQIDLTHTAVAEYESTLVSPEGELVGLPIPHGTEWICRDIDGEISMLEAVSEGENSEYMILKKAELDLTLIYDGEENWLSINYQTDIERDEAFVDVNNKINAWNHAKWSGFGGTSRIMLRDDGVFLGKFEDTTTYENTYPESSTHQLTHTHHFFGLIPPLDYHLLYLCDLSANPVPDPLGSMTAEDFQKYCVHWYYVCSISAP